MEFSRKNLIKLAHAKKDFVIATIVAHHGSTPRSTGTKMLILPDGQIFGTIGGGALEAKVIQQSLSLLIEKKGGLQSYQFSGKDAASMDMICGGEVLILFTYVSPNNSDFFELQNIFLDWEEKGERFIEVTGQQENGICLFGGVNLSTGKETGWLPDKNKWQYKHETWFQEINGISVFSEFHEPVTTIYIFGAGHVGQAVAIFAKQVGFRVIVIDDREEFANSARFPQADNILVTPSITDIFQNRKFTPSDYIVIVTRGHLQDFQVLEAALQTHAGYIGMIGSRRKNQLIFQALREKGVPEEKIQQVHAPIGLAIGAETPEEIGISILAEIIQYRAQSRKSQGARPLE